MNISQRTVLVTGATAGLGNAVSALLLCQGHTVLVHGRNEEKARRACGDLTRAVEISGAGEEEGRSARAVPVWGDLSVVAEVRNLAEQVGKEAPDLSAVINNAGKSFPERRESVDGIELTLAVNALAAFLLTSLLLPHLRGDGRVVNLAGMYHKKAEFDLDDLEYRRRPYEVWAASNSAQMMRVLITLGLARRLAETDRAQVSVCVHPGAVLTDAQKALPWFLRLFIHTLARPGFVKPARAAHPIAALAVGSAVPANGAYYEKERLVRTIDAAYNEGLQDECWQRCCQLTGATWPF